MGRGLRGALDEVVPPDRFGDQRNILGNTGQNVLGLAVGAVATFVAQVLMTNALGAGAFGVVTLTTQFAFIAAAATRFGMDVANVRLVAILVGKGESGRVRGLVRRSAVIAAAVSVASAAAALLGAEPLAEAFSGLPDEALPAFRAAAITIPVAALAFTYMGATRGLKIMRHTLYAQWLAQPIGWIVFALTFWTVARTAGATTLAFGASWLLALVIAWWGWERETRGLGQRTDTGGIPQESTGALVRFGALRAPATLFSQLIFWTDFFVLSTLAIGRAGAETVGVYGAALRAAQSLFLFLTSVSLTFSPFVADLHHRGERERLDGLYKSVTRWTLGATIPVLLVLAILPGPVLRVFGGEFAQGEAALRILIMGMIVPVTVGTVGFILIMAGRTGWDLVVYMGAFAIDVGVAFALARPEILGIRGAAIAQALTLSFSALARLALVRRFLGIWPFDARFLRLVIPTLVGAAVMAGVDLLIDDAEWLLELVVAGGIGSAAYVVLLLAIGITPRERRMALSLASRVVGRVPRTPSTLEVRPIADAERAWLARLLDAEWGGQEQVLERETYRPLDQDALISEDGGAAVGVVTFERRGSEMVVGLIHALERRRGVGTALMREVIRLARDVGCTRVRVVTTNDNLAAQRFYEALGFALREIRPGAVARARLRKPTIPLAAADGTPITDELEYVLELRATGSPNAD